MWDVLYQEIKKLLRINEIMLQEPGTQLEREGLTSCDSLGIKKNDMIAVD